MSDPKTVKIRIETEDEIQEYETTALALCCKEEETGYFNSLFIFRGDAEDLIKLAKSLQKRVDYIKEQIGVPLAEILLGDCKESEAADSAEVIV